MARHVQTCRSCGEDVEGELYHLGFSDFDCMYCDSCPRVLLLRDHDLAKRNGIEWPNLKPEDAGWEPWNQHLLPVYKKIEDLFRPCLCGGRFRFMAPPRCPMCNEHIFGKGYEDKPIARQNEGYAFITIGSVCDKDQIGRDVT